MNNPLTQQKNRASTNRTSGGFRGNEDGVALVEFALVLPLLVLLLFGITEFGRAMNYWIDQNHLANTAARWAVVDKNPGPGTTLQDSIRLQAGTAGLRDGATVCIDFPDGAASKVGDPVRATVTYEFAWLPLIGDTIGAAETSIQGSATMRLEKEPSSYAAGCSGAAPQT
jgi:hypothetical protein